MNAISEDRKELVLVVDDDEAARYAKVRTLRAANFDLVEAPTGMLALEQARRHLPDVVLLDVRLPDIDGFEVCQRLRANPETSYLSIVHITASFQNIEDRVRGLEGGADSFLLAPVEPEILVATVRAMMRLRRVENALRHSEARYRILSEKLADADRRKDEFLATLAHELRNPLAPIRNALQVMNLARGNPALTEQSRLIMERQVAHLVHLVDDLLDVSRISSGKLELRRKRITVNEAVDVAIESVRPIVEAAGHQLTVSLPSEPAYVNADLTRLSQIFINLLNNAAKYTPAGGRISLCAQVADGKVVIEVKDNGIGIPADALTHIFEMFMQVDRSLERTTGGLGIGLSLVNGLVKMHNGSVRAHSDGPGKGTAIYVQLPLDPGP